MRQALIWIPAVLLVFLVLGALSGTSLDLGPVELSIIMVLVGSWVVMAIWWFTHRKPKGQ
jgi:hypothetical protein